MKGCATDLDRIIGANIRLRRIERGLTQARLATALSISFQQLQKIERGINRVSASRLFQIADLFSLSVDVFRSAPERDETYLPDNEI